MKNLILLSIAALFSCYSFALAEEAFDDLEGSVQSKEFTSAERRYFTDAINLYKKYELRGDFKIRSAVAWLDNEHIVFSARKLPGWEAKAYEHPRIILMNVITGEYKDTGYRGRLICLNHLGDMILRQGGDEIIPNSSTVNYEWLIGKWGESLTKVERDPSTFIPNYLCKFVPYGDPIHALSPEKITPDMHRKLPLLPEHGYFRESVQYAEGKKIYPVFLVKPDGSSFYITENLPLDFNFYFYPWINAYFEKNPLRYIPRVFYPTGSYSHISAPKLLEYWSAKSPSMSAGGVLTKAGMLWDVHQGYGYWKKQGLYLDTPSGLLRVDIGRGSGSVLSPDGCKLLDSVLRDDPYGRFFRNYVWLVIDFCTYKKVN